MLDNSTENNSCGKGHLFAQCCILWWQFNLESDSYFLSDERKIHYNLAKASPAPCKLLFVRVFECYILDDGSLWKSNIIPWQWVFISPYVPQVIFQNLFTHLDWNWFRVDYYCDWNWLTVIIDFVSRVARHCKVSSILEIWSYNKSAIAHLTYNDVIRDINQVKTRWAKSVWCETVCTLNKFVYGIKPLSTLDLCNMYIVLSCFFVMTFILH